MSSLAGRRELRRYSRHLLIPEVGLAGQERLGAARVLVVGIGGLGSPVLQYLTAAGVGRIGAIDDDAVDETNLQRQTLFSTADVGRSKAAVAAERLRALNPGVRIDAIEGRFDASNARDLVRMYDVVVDCTDRFPTRYLINDACVLEKKPDVYGSIFRFDGQVSVFGLDDGPCYRCLYPEAPPEGTVPTCAEGGVLGALAGIVGAWQASETLKIVLGIGEPLRGRLMLIETLSARVREVRFDRDAECAVCGDRPAITDAAAGRRRRRRDPAGFEEIDAIAARRSVEERHAPRRPRTARSGARPHRRRDLNSRLRSRSAYARTRHDPALHRRVSSRRTIPLGDERGSATPVSAVSSTCAADF